MVQRRGGETEEGEDSEKIKKDLARLLQEAVSRILLVFL